MQEQSLVQGFFNKTLSEVMDFVKNGDDFAPHIFVLTKTAGKQKMDINVMEVPSMVELMEKQNAEKIIEAKRLLDTFIAYLEIEEKKIKVALFHAEIYVNEEGEFIYTYQVVENNSKVCRYAINRKDMNIDKDGNFNEAIDIELVEEL